MDHLYEYRVTLDRVVDGDTYDFIVDLGFHVSKKVRIRMMNLDTAEIYGVKKESDEYARGIEQMRFVEDWFDEADELYIQTENDEQGKYGRWLARVYNEDGECLNDVLRSQFDIAAVVQ